MNNKNNKKVTLRCLSIFLVFIILVIPFISISSALNNEAPEKTKIEHTKYGGNLLFKDNNKYKNKHIEINSDIKNTIDYETAIFSKDYVSVSNYDKKKNDLDYEVKFYTGNHDVLYDVYKSDLVGVSKKEVKDTGKKIKSVKSYQGYVTVNVTGFSTIVLTIPDFTLPVYNRLHLNLDQYFDDTDHYEVKYYHPVNNNYLTLEEGFVSLNTDYFEVDLYSISTEVYVDFEFYDRVCNETYCNFPNNLTNSQPTLIKVISYDDVSETGFVAQEFEVFSCDLDCLRPSFANGLIPDIEAYFGFNEHHYSKYFGSLSPPYAIDWDSFEYIQASSTPDSWSLSFGIIDGAFDFDGTDKFSIDNFINTQGSISLWVDADVLSNSMFLTETDPSTNNFLMFGTDGNSKLKVGTNINSIYSDNSLTTGWKHIVFTSDGSQWKIYLNGIEQSFSISGSNNGDWFGDFAGTITNIGVMDRSSTDLYFNGVIDEFIVFDRVISQTEIDFLYNSGSPPRFQNLNTPYPTQLGFCLGNSSNCNNPSTYKYEGDLVVGGNVYINLENYFVDDFEDYDFFVYYYDFIDNEFKTLNDSFGTAHGELYDLNLVDGVLQIYYYGNFESNPLGFEGYLQAVSSLGEYDEFGNDYSINLPFDIYFEPDQVAPPNQTQPLGIPRDVTNESTEINLNNYFTNYETLHLKYNDNGTTQNIIVDRDGSSAINITAENISVNVDPTNISNNIIITISKVGNNSYNDEFNFTVSNNNGSISDVLTITANYFEPVYIISENITNQSVKIGSSLILNLSNYFINLSYSKLNFSYENVSYFINSTEPCDNVSCPISIEGVNKITLDDFIISLDGEKQLIFASLQNNISLNLLLRGYDINSNSGLQDFYIITSEVIGSKYDSLKDLFFAEDEQIKKNLALIFIGSVIILTIMFIGIPLNFNNLSILLIYVLSMLSVFVMSWVEYIEWKYFVVPLIIGVTYYLIRLLGGNK